MSGTCQNCGDVSTDTVKDSPANPAHCSECPPWRCDDCGSMCSAKNLCPCWTPLEGMALADIKAVFAASDMSIDIPKDPR